MSVATAVKLRRLLEADGVFVHPSLEPRAFPSMGGGLGMVATRPLPGGTALAHFPPRCMITARKARYHLALVEVDLARQQQQRLHPKLLASNEPFVLTFASHVLGTEEEQAQLGDHDRWAAVKQKEEELMRRLSPTSTIASYLALLAALFGRQTTPEGRRTSEGGAASALLAASAAPRDDDDSSSPPTIHFRYDSAWMGLWVRSLPLRYDNLLELAQATLPTAPPLADGGTEASVDHGGADELRPYLSFSRHREVVVAEHARVVARYHECLDALACLRSLPRGCDLSEYHPACTVPSADDDEAEMVSHLDTGASPSGANSRCSLTHYLWALNTLLTRGFAYQDDVWAVMPYVDYFNYDLGANGSMWPENDPSAPIPGDGPHYLCCSYHFQTVRPVAAGEQIHLHYGAYTDVELLLWYGFTLRPVLLPISELSSLAEGPGVCSQDDPMEAATVRASRELVPLQPPEWPIWGLGLTPIVPCLANRSQRRRIFNHLLARRQRRDGTDETNRCIPITAPDDLTLANEEGAAMDYDQWCCALQRAFGYVFSPLADADGVYPRQTASLNWVRALASTFLSLPGLPTDSGSVEVAAVAAWARMMAEVLVREQQSVSLSGIRLTDCRLGVLCPSPNMRGLINAIAAGCASSKPSGKRKAVPSGETRAMVLRSFAWMELYSNCSRDPPVTIPRSLNGACNRVVSMAVEASQDGWTLLRYLAIEASPTDLTTYLAQVAE